MGAQIIRRKAGKMPEIATVDGDIRQVSYNSDGKLAVRYIYSQNDDALIVFDEKTSWIIKNFCKNHIV